MRMQIQMEMQTQIHITVFFPQGILKRPDHDQDPDGCKNIAVGSFCFFFTFSELKI